MPNADAYGAATARYYDGVYEQLLDSRGDVDWYRGLARASGGPVLELGAGTGRVLLEIAADGIPCTGLELSGDMLDALRAKGPPAGVRLVQGSMHDFELGERFALVTCPFRAFQHLETVDEQLACLACVRRHLAPGGRFAFDVFVPDLAQLADPETEEHEDARSASDGDEIVRFVRVAHDAVLQRLDVRMRYERRRDDRVLGEDIADLRMRYFFRYELEHLLARGGFRELELYGDFSGAAFGEASRDFVVVARPDPD